MMRIMIGILLFILTVDVSAQYFIEEHPWNPDMNQDDFIGTSDLTGFLSVFGQEFGSPPPQCDYDGTPIEEWLSGVLSEEIILDSLFIEFQLEDSSEVYFPGCPDPTLEVAILSFSEMMTDINWAGTGYSGPIFGGQILRSVSDNGLFIFAFHYSGSTGEYRIYTRYPYLATAGYENDGLFGTSNVIWSDPLTLPFDSTNTFSEDGLVFDSNIWSDNEWPHFANYLHIIPYWHLSE